jgi:hypothetical protein
VPTPHRLAVSEAATAVPVGWAWGQAPRSKSTYSKATAVRVIKRPAVSPEVVEGAVSIDQARHSLSGTSVSRGENVGARIGVVPASLPRKPSGDKLGGIEDGLTGRRAREIVAHP